MAFAVANACAYVQAAIDRGVAVDDFAPRLSWIFNTHTDFFEEIAKYRALRRLWAELMRDRFGARKPQSQMLRTHTQTGGSTLTAQQPENNIVRAAIQALAAVLGGVQSLALSCYDEALSIPTRKAQRIAVRTQQIIGEEIGVTSTVDPLGGSYFVEALTDELQRRALRADRGDRPPRRRRRLHRVGLDAGADPVGGLPRRAGGGQRREGGGRGESPHRERRGRPDADLPARRAGDERAARAAAAATAPTATPRPCAASLDVLVAAAA